MKAPDVGGLSTCSKAQAPGPANRRRSALGAALTVACIGLLVTLPMRHAGATILLFDQERNAVVVPTSSGGIVPPDYGDNVTGAAMAVPGGVFTYGNGGEGFTPNVTVDLFTSLATPTDPRVRLWQTGYGDLVNVVFGEGPGTAGSPILNVRFTAEPGFVVDLYGFDLARFPNQDYTTAGVDVLAGAVSLFSATDVPVEGDPVGPRRTTFAFGPPLSAPDLLLRVDVSNLAAAIQDNIGIDSIRFGQTPPPTIEIPEPATLLLLLGGLAIGAAGRRWRPPTRLTPPPS